MAEVQPSGWYDDPQNDDNLRYWDGVSWTEHVASKHPRYDQGAVVEPAAGASSDQWAAYQAQQDRQGRREGGVRSRGEGHEAPLAGWWRRVGALVLDWLLVAVVSSPLTLSRFAGSSQALDQWMVQTRQAIEAGAAAPAVPEQFVSDIAFATLVQTVVYILLEVWMLSRWGVTPGRRLTGIRVRPLGVDGPVPVAIGLRRTIVKSLNNLLGGIPLLGTASAFFQIADYLWPLWDKGNQALHDKFAATEVVRSRAPVRRP